MADQGGDGPGTDLRNRAGLARRRWRLALLLLRRRLTGRLGCHDPKSLPDILGGGFLGGDLLHCLLSLYSLELVESSVSESKENDF